MADRPRLDLAIKNARRVRPDPHAVETRDLGITNDRFAREVFDARAR
jgi:hypothetical protein